VIEKASQKHATVLKDSGGTTTQKVMTTGASTAAPKPAKVIRAADLSPTIYLETEAEVESYVAKLSPNCSPPSRPASAYASSKKKP
jgi:hypothetical protein